MRLYLDDDTASALLTRLLRKQETLRGALPHAQRLARQVNARRSRPRA